MIKYEDKGIKAICLILLLAAGIAAGAALFGGGAAIRISPRSIAAGVDKSELKRQLFVSGAFLREGCYEASADMTYRQLFETAGLYENADISGYDLDRYIDMTLERIILGYFEEGLLCPSLDINSAGEEELLRIGLDEGEARALAGGRPYKRRDELLSRGILSPQKYYAIEHKIFAGQGE